MLDHGVFYARALGDWNRRYLDWLPMSWREFLLTVAQLAAFVGIVVAVVNLIGRWVFGK